MATAYTPTTLDLARSVARPLALSIVVALLGFAALGAAGAISGSTAAGVATGVVVGSLTVLAASARIARWKAGAVTGDRAARDDETLDRLEPLGGNKR